MATEVRHWQYECRQCGVVTNFAMTGRQLGGFEMMLTT